MDSQRTFLGRAIEGGRSRSGFLRSPVFNARSIRSALAVVALCFTGLSLLLLYANFRLHMGLRGMASEAGLELEYGAAYTLIPGEVTLRGLRVTGGTKFLWTVGLPRAELQVSVADLLFGRLHVHSLRGDALSIRVAGFGYEEGPVFAPKRRLTALGMIGFTGTNENALRIDRLYTSVETLEIGEYDLSGSVQLRATNLELSPRAPVLGQAVLSMDSAALSRGDEEVLRWLQGRLILERNRAQEPSFVASTGVFLSSAPSPELTGTLHLFGADAGELLEFAGVPEPVSVLFSNIQGQPFKVATEFEQRPGALFLREVRAESGSFRAVGAFRDTTTDRAGVFLLTLRELSAGILVGARESDLVMGADRAWLTQFQDVLGLP